MSQPDARPPAMMDVARLAGVSHQTVSRVLNGSPLVRADTAERVRVAIEATGYRPNRNARALATQRSGLIGILASGFPHLGPATTVGAIETAARAAGFSAVARVHGDPGPSEVIDSMYAFVEHGVQGIAVVTPRRETAELAVAKAHGIPVVLIGGLPDNATTTNQVIVDQVLGGRLAAEALINGGRTKIAHVSGPVGWFDGDCRVIGWRQALDAAGLSATRLVAGDWGAQRGYEVGMAWPAHELPDAVFCANDLTALGLLAAFRQRGLRVPDDVAVIGFDDIPAAEFVDPSLSTVHQPLEEVGERCVQVLLSAIDGADLTVNTLPPTVVLRGSTR